MNRKYLSFDLETAKVQPPDAKNWKQDRPLGISCAATVRCDADAAMLWYGLTKTNRPARQMSQNGARKLVKYLSRMVSSGYTLLTWNGVGFDFDILAEESGLFDKCKQLALGHVDMMFHVLCQRGFGVSLNSAARAMGLSAKEDGIDGTNAPRLWAEGKRGKVLEYVSRDAQVTLQLARMCEKSGYVCWTTRAGRRQEMQLRHGWLSVRDAQRLPPPRIAWMCKYWSRGKWTAWMR